MIVDATTGHALVKAEARAYAEEIRNAPGPCPRHEKPLDGKLTDHTGAFELAIDTSYASYFAVYCSGGYAAREVPINDNRAPGRVSPDPVRLFPGGATSDPMQGRKAIDRVIDDAGSDLRYYEGADPQGFRSAASELPPEDQRAITTLLKRGAPARTPGVRPGQARAARAAIELVLHEAGGHFNYFARVAEGAFFQSLNGLANDDRVTVEWLRRRASGVRVAGAR